WRRERASLLKRHQYGLRAVLLVRHPCQDVTARDVRLCVLPFRRQAGARDVSIEKPEIDFPGGEPPADLEIKDIWEGDGAVAQAGQTVTVHYVGVSFSTGEEFAASWNRGQPFRFLLGGGRVSKGWDQGVQGVEVGGGRR